MTDVLDTGTCPHDSAHACATCDPEWIEEEISQPPMSASMNGTSTNRSIDNLKTDIDNALKAKAQAKEDSRYRAAVARGVEARERVEAETPKTFKHEAADLAHEMPSNEDLRDVVKGFSDEMRALRKDLIATISAARPDAIPDAGKRLKWNAAVERETKLGNLQATARDNGDIEFRLPLPGIPEALRPTFVSPVAFVLRVATAERPEHIEVAGRGSAALEAAMATAKKKWGEDEIVISARDRDLKATVKAAVKADLNIHAGDPHIAALVAQAKVEIARPMHKRTLGERAPTITRMAKPKMKL